jgi:hypothetical protein
MGEEHTCVDAGPYGPSKFDGAYGYFKWDAVAGVEYKVIAHAVGAFGLCIVTPL